MIRRILSAAMLFCAVSCARAEPVRDPFARPAAARAVLEVEAAVVAEPEPVLALRAIMFSTGRSLVNINGRILGEGEFIGDYRVSKIQERSVVLSRGPTQRVLALEPESIRK